MKILVTGGAGFVGSQLTDRLVDANHEVVIIDDLSTGKREYLNKNAKFYELDINAPEVAKVFQEEKFDIVFHLAAQIDVRCSVADPELDNTINVLGSLKIFRHSVENKVKKIIFFSTCAIYGNVDEPISEDGKVVFEAPYAVHKFAAEKNLELICQASDTDYIIFRPSNFYGPRQYKGGEGAVVPIFVYNHLNDEESIIYGDGLQSRDFLYVDDVLDACLLTLDKKISGVFNFSSGKEINLLELINFISGATGKDFKFHHEAERKGEIRRSVLSPKKAKDILGWEAKTSFEEGIKKTIDWTNSL